MRSKKVPLPVLRGASPISVAIMDDDFGSLIGYTAILTRDPRTSVNIEALNPTSLINSINGERSDVIVLDAEYQPYEPPLAEFVKSTRESKPDSVIICWSQYVNPGAIHASVNSEACGFLIKEEIKYGIATAVALAHRGYFVMTPSVKEVLEEELTRTIYQKHCILSWDPPSSLTPVLNESFELRVLYGMRASLAAVEVFKAIDTIEKYVNTCYRALEYKWDYVDEQDIENIVWENLSREDQAFILYTQPIIEYAL